MRAISSLPWGVNPTDDCVKQPSSLTTVPAAVVCSLVMTIKLEDLGLNISVPLNSVLMNRRSVGIVSSM